MTSAALLYMVLVNNPLLLCLAVAVTGLVMAAKS